MPKNSGKIAYLVSHHYDDILKRAKIFRDEHADVTPCFEALGFRCEKVDWRSKRDWTEFICLIPKAVWDYFDRPQEFSAFLKSLKSNSIRLTNPVRTVLWNMDKRYLLDYVASNLPTIPTVIYPRASSPEAPWFSQFKTSTILAKPAISGGSKNTIRFAPRDWKNHSETFEAVLREGDLLIQPYLAEVEQGEYSFFFFAGQFSHAILKRPKKGDFRAHSFFGADIAPYPPTKEEIVESQRFLDLAPDPCAYARVDLIRTKGGFCLVEIEMIEPYLYMEYSTTNAARSFAEAVVRSL